MTGRPPVLLRRFQHSFHENSISSGWVIQKHMGHGADKFSVLKDGAAGHALDDAAGGGDQLRVRHRDHQISSIRRVLYYL